jgi:hypothetical protein
VLEGNSQVAIFESKSTKFDREITYFRVKKTKSQVSRPLSKQEVSSHQFSTAFSYHHLKRNQVLNNLILPKVQVSKKETRMGYIHNILFNPNITGHGLLQPAYSIASTIAEQWNASVSCLEEVPLVWKVKTVKHCAALVGVVALAIVSSPLLIVSYVAGGILKTCLLYQADTYIKRPLRVRKIAPEDYPEIAKISRTWQRIASAQHNQVNAEQKVFDDCYTVSKLVAQCLESPAQYFWLFNQAFICVDGKDQIQGIALTQTSDTEFTYTDYTGQRYVKIVHIVTNPHNIRSIVNARDFERIEGAGTALIKNIAKAAEGRGLYLESVHSAIPFYQKLGFTRISRLSVSMVKRSCSPMILTTEKIQNLLAA